MKSTLNKKGYALALTIIILAIIPLLGTALLSTITSEIRMNKAIEHNTIAKYLAEAGMEHGLSLIEEYTSEEDNIWAENGEFNYGLGRIYSYEVFVRLDYSDEGDIVNIELTSTGTANIKGNIKTHLISRTEVVILD